MFNQGEPVKQGEVHGERLSHYHFNDLYVSTDINEPPLVRRMVLSGTNDRAVNGVHHVPKIVMGDVEKIREEVQRVSVERGFFERETQVTYDGVTYRCALIAEPPQEDNPYEVKAPNIQTWCLRRIGNYPPDLQDLRLPPFLYKAIRESFNDRGLVIVSGSFGSGKTTTASACLQDWVRQATEVAVTLEDPPEFPLGVPDGEGKIYQINMNDADPAEGIKQVRRYAPRYVFLGEIRTPEAARELLHISASGPLTLCTIHASDPIQALTSLILFASSAMAEDMAKQIAARGISMIIHQEMSNGVVQAKLLEIADDDYGIQSKIRAGRYDLLYEDFENQRIRRQQTKGAGRSAGGVRTGGVRK